jgi:ABC-type uncharacterized transport system permease subunit
MLVAILPVTLIGLLSYRLFIDPIREHEGAVLIATIALAMAMQEIMLLLFTGDFLGVPSLIEGYRMVFGVKVAYQQLLSVAVALLVLAVVWAFLLKTRLGLAIRSTAQDREVANLVEAAWVAARKDPALLRAFEGYCQRMRETMAIVKIARKLLNRIRFVLKNHKPYVPAVV